jgi:hypothetical protein
LLKHAQKNKTLNKYLTSKLQFSSNFTLDSVADSNYRGKYDVGGFLIFEWTICIVVFSDIRAVTMTVCWHYLLFQFSNFEFPNLAI